MPEMKTLGLLGGTFYTSTTLYYTAINDVARNRLGGVHSAPLLLHSFDYATILDTVTAANGDHASVSSLLIPAARNLVSIGAQGIVICANLVHAGAVALQEALGPAVPVLHVVDAIGSKMKGKGVQKIGLLATKTVITSHFYVPPLREKHGIEVLVPEVEDTDWVDWIVFNELGKGVVSPESKARFLAIVEGFGKRGVEAVVLACTDLAPLLEGEMEDGKVRGVRVFDSTILHAEFVAEWALGTP